MRGTLIYLAKARSSAHGWERLVDVAVVCAGAAGVWAAARPLIGARELSRRWARGLALATGIAIVAAAAVLIAGLGQRGGGGGLAHGRPAQWHDAIQTAVDRPILGSGADTYFAASRKHQGATASRYAHDLPLESWAELGLLGVAATLALYGAVGLAAWRARAGPAAWLLGPAAVTFLVTNLLDWPWHLAGAGALWALAVGGLLAPAAAGPRARAPGAPRRTA